MRVIVNESGKKFFIDEKQMPESLDTKTDGRISRESVLNAVSGSVIKSDTGKSFFVLEPGFVDYFETLERGPQIITLKDAGFIIANTGLCSGSKVIEAGAGSGAFSGFLAQSIKPEGKVITYEIRDDFLKLAEKNLEKMGLKNNVLFKNKSIYEGIDETEVDAVVLDLPEPWNVVKHALNALKVGGYFVAYIPTTTQVQITVEELINNNFHVSKISEVLEREWKVEGRVMRPQNLMLGHTGFIIIARKIISENIKKEDEKIKASSYA